MISKYETDKRKTVNRAIAAARIASIEYDNIDDNFLRFLSENIQEYLKNIPDGTCVPLEKVINDYFFDIDLNDITMADWIWMFRHAIEVGEFYISHDENDELFISLK